MLNIITASILVLVAFVGAAQASEDEACTKAPREQWMSVEQLKGSMSQQSCPDPSAFERAHYIRTVSGYHLEKRRPEFDRFPKRP